jgi:hypothetical protein
MMPIAFQVGNLTLHRTELSPSELQNGMAVSHSTFPSPDQATYSDHMIMEIEYLFQTQKKCLYLYCPYYCIISKFSMCILSNTTRQILMRTHYMGDMFQLVLWPSSGLTQNFE